MPRRTKWIVVLYGLALVLPLVFIGAHSGPEIGTWLSTGICPAGPMDRPAQPCGLLGFVTIVFLGGWSAFIVLPMLAIWWAGVTIATFAIWRGWRGRPSCPT